MARVKVSVIGKFVPHRLLIGGAAHHLESAKKKMPGYFYELLSSILFSALAIEAIGNAYGEALIPCLRDFETCSPIAKLRLIAMNCGINIDFEKHPWGTARQLIQLRNLVAHAKPKNLSSEKETAHDDYQKYLYMKPESPLEKMVTEGFAVTGYDAVEKILEKFSEKIDPTKLIEIEVESWSAQASVIPDNTKRV